MKCLVNGFRHRPLVYHFAGRLVNEIPRYRQLSAPNRVLELVYAADLHDQVFHEALRGVRFTLGAEPSGQHVAPHPRMLSWQACLDVPGCAYPRNTVLPPDPAGLFSEGGEVIKLHMEGSLTISRPGIKRV